MFLVLSQIDFDNINVDNFTYKGKVKCGRINAKEYINISGGVNALRDRFRALHPTDLYKKTSKYPTDLYKKCPKYPTELYIFSQKYPTE